MANDNPLTIDQIVERMACKLCFLENEIWDEAPQAYRDRWRHEAAQMLVSPKILAALQSKEAGEP